MAWASGAHPTYLRARCPIAVRALLRQVRLAWTVSLEDGVFQEWLVKGAAPGRASPTAASPCPFPAASACRGRAGRSKTNCETLGKWVDGPRA